MRTITTEWGTFHPELSPSEAIMWKGDDQARLRSGGVLMLLLERPPDWPRLVRAFEHLSRQFPRFRQRIMMTPFGLGRPRWIVDPDFDVTVQLSRVALPAPGDTAQLLELIARDTSAAFDTLRPPWEATLVEGLADGRAALLLRSHHALFDGKGMMQVLDHWFDRAADAAEPPPVPPPPPQYLTEIDLLRQAVAPRRVVANVGQTAGSVLGLAKLVLQPGELLEKVRDTGRSFALLADSSIPPRSPLLTEVSNRVRLAVFDVPFGELRGAAKAGDATLNDALLTVVAGAFGRYHEKLGKPVDTVNLAFPISIRTDDDDIAGNRFGGATVPAPTGADVAARMTAIRELVLAARDRLGADILGPLTAALYRLPSWLIAAVPFTEKVDAQISNFPGLRHRHWLAGAEVLGTYGFGPHPGTPLMVVLISHGERCCVALNADAATINDMPLFVQCFAAALTDLLALRSSKPGERSGKP